MQDVSAEFLDAITGTFRPVQIVDAWYDGELIFAGVPITEAQVTMDSTRGVTGACTLTVASDDETLIPQAWNSPLAPYGSEIQIRVGLAYGGGIQELLSLGWYRIDSADPERYHGRYVRRPHAPRPGPAGYEAVVRALGAAFYWRLDDPPGTTTSTDRIVGRPAVVSGNVGYTATFGVTPDPWDSGAGAIYVAGTGGLNPTPTTAVAAAAITYAAWFKTTTRIQGSVIGNNNLLYLSPTSPNGAIVNTPGSGITDTALAARLADGQWHHAVVTNSQAANELKLYVDGELAGQNVASTITAAVDNGIGRGTAYGIPWNGTIAHVAIWNRPITADEVARLYAATRDAGNAGDTIVRPFRALRVAVEGSDRLAYVDDARLLAPEQPASLTSVQDEIARLVQGLIAPGDWSAIPDAAVPRSIAYSDSRLSAITDLAAVLSTVPRADPDGALGLYPASGGNPVWTVNVPDDAVTWSAKLTRDGLYNAVVATSEADEPVQGVATETTGPLRWGGPFGMVPYGYSSPLLANNAQAQAAAVTRLASLARDRVMDVTVTCVANPALELGDVIAVNTETLTLTGPVTAITLPIPLSSMDVTISVPRAAIWGGG